MLCKEKWQNSQYKKALCRSREPFARYEIGRKESIELLSVLASSFRLLLTLQAGANIVLSLLNLSDNAILRTAALKSLERTLQRLIFFYADLRHDFPSLRCISHRNALRAIRWLFLLYAMTREMSSTNMQVIHQNHEKSRASSEQQSFLPAARNTRAFYLMIRLMSLPGTTMVFRTSPPRLAS